MPLSPQQSHRRRLALIAAGLSSVAVLVAALALPVWHADAGGLERGERARPSRTKAAARDQRDQDKARAQRQRDAEVAPPRGTDARPARSIDPSPTGPLIAEPLPYDPAHAARPSPSLRPASPRPLSPPLSSPDPRLSEPQPDGAGVALEALKAVFRRPEPARTARGQEALEVALGARLFAEKKLSADHKMSCATCHDPRQSFADGRRTARGNKGQALPRNTPALWNVDRQRAFYWDGRAPTLEAQVKDAIERDGEMDATIEAAVLWLSRDPTYVRAFEQAYGAREALTGDNVLKALAAYERTLASPETRFDRWVAGDIYALSEREVAGFRLFTGKARCLACHGGWRLTDDIFHDVGVRSKDPGRHAIAGGPERAFKTPSLREAVWSAPYMHDGSLKSLDDVVAHYAGKLEDRPSLAPELKRGIVLSEPERANLVAFLKTLSSASQPRPPALP